MLTTLLPGPTLDAKRREAISVLAEMAGAGMLSRIVPDRTGASEIIQTVPDDLVDRPISA